MCFMIVTNKRFQTTFNHRYNRLEIWCRFSSFENVDFYFVVFFFFLSKSCSNGFHNMRLCQWDFLPFFFSISLSFESMPMCQLWHSIYKILNWKKQFKKRTRFSPSDWFNSIFINVSAALCQSIDTYFFAFFFCCLWSYQFLFLSFFTIETIKEVEKSLI